MPRLAPEQLASLTQAIRADDQLQRLVAEIEKLHRVVFHANERADWSLVRQSAEQILVAEMVGRYGGQPEAVHEALRAREDAGRSRDAAVGDLAAAVHSYYTTPLGVVMRHDLLGDEVVFFTPDAHEWTTEHAGRGGRGEAE